MILEMQRHLEIYQRYHCAYLTNQANFDLERDELVFLHQLLSVDVYQDECLAL